MPGEWRLPARRCIWAHGANCCRRLRSVGHRARLPPGAARARGDDVGVRARGRRGDRHPAYEFALPPGRLAPGDHPGIGGRPAGGGERGPGRPRPPIEPSARGVDTGGPGRAARRDRRGRHEGHRGADPQADVDGPRGDDAGSRARAARLPLRPDLRARGRPGTADRRCGRPGAQLHRRPLAQPHARDAGGRGRRPGLLPRTPALGGRRVLDRGGCLRPGPEGGRRDAGHRAGVPRVAPRAAAPGGGATAARARAQGGAARHSGFGRMMGARTVKFGLTLPQFGASWSEVEEIALLADEVGWDSVWVADDFLGVGSGDPLEAWTEMSAVAAITRRVELGFLVLCNSYRPPALLAKMATTLDALSRGRLILGYGAGWFVQEYEAYGYDFPNIGTRLGQLEEGLQVLTRRWTEEQATFHGAHYRGENARCLPRPTRKPHPPRRGDWEGAACVTAAGGSARAPGGGGQCETSHDPRYTSVSGSGVPCRAAR